MSLAFFLKNNLEKLPISLGIYLSKIPFSLRPGLAKSYRKSNKEILKFEQSGDESKKQIIFDKMYEITKHAYNNIPFYHEFYNKRGFNPNNDLKTFDDIKNIPIIYKRDLINVPLEKRSYQVNANTVIANTGGSTGRPLSFYLPSIKMGIEWAHLHYIWKIQSNYSQKDLKVLLVGRGEVKDYVSYDFLRNVLRFDIFSSYDNIQRTYLKKYSKYRIKYLRGYPSALYELARYCNKNESLKRQLTKHLKGIFLVSEFPDKIMRNYIEKVFDTKTYSFYGHTEGCIIAFEKDVKELFKPLHSYGYCETVKLGNEDYLLGTNYYNFNSPLIRYNTEDVVTDIKQKNNLVYSFRIIQGRKGEFILDKKEKKIPLTGLIYGRHHELFNYAASIQIRQIKPGKAEILYVSNIKIDKPINNLFSSDGIDIDFNYTRIDRAIKTPMGKLNLLVK